MTRPAMRVSMCVAALCAAAGAARSAEGVREPERLDMPAAKIEGPVRLSAPTPGFAPERVLNVPTFTQVNVTAAQQNIVGDAANEPSLAVDVTNNRGNFMAIGWRQFDSVSSNFRQAGVAYTIDGGRTWKSPVGGPKLTPGVFRSDPVLRPDADGNFVYHSLLTTFDANTFLSTDGGRNWSAPRTAAGGDKTWLAFDRTSGASRNFAYVAWNPSGSNFPANVIFGRSLDAAATWPTTTTILNTPFFGTVDVDDRGWVYVFGRNSAGSFFVSRSNNALFPAQTPAFVSAAVNLTAPQVLSSPSSPNPGGLLGQGWIAIDKSQGLNRGNIYVCCSVGPRTVGTAGGLVVDPLDVMFSRSVDGGQTWSAALKVNDDAPTTNAWQWFATMSVSPDGRIDIVYNDTRDSQSVTASRLYYTSSNNGGVSFAPSQPVTQAFNSLVGFPQQNKIGDYYDMTSDRVGAHVAMAATFNGEQDVWYIRIGDYDCNNNGVPDATDIALGTSKDCNNNGIPDECERRCPGDANSDNTVNFADLALVLANFGTSAPITQCLPGDVTGDGQVSFADLAQVLAQFGNTCQF